MFFHLPIYLATKLPFYKFLSSEKDEQAQKSIEEAIAKLPADIRDDFSSASNHLRAHGGKMSQEDLLALYGLYKMVIAGPTSYNDRPGPHRPTDRAKWQAWYDASDRSKKECAELYVAKVQNANIGWRRGQKVDNKSGGGFGMRPSRMTLDDGGDATTSAHLADTQDNDVLQAIRDGDLETLISLINSISSNGQLECMLNTHYNGLTPLHWAADRGHKLIVKKLIELGAPINAFSIDDERNTPLHLAIIADHVDCARLLVDRGADYDLLDADGQTPFDYAETQNMKDALNL